MSQAAVAALAPPPFELVLDDGEPLESEWHTLQYPLLRELIRQAMAEQGRTDFYTGGNMFVYYSVEQARRVYDEEKEGLEKQAFRGPDVFFVDHVDPERKRPCWAAWNEAGRLPDVVFELLSPSTEHKDRTEKRDLYAGVWQTAEYFLHDPETSSLEGLRLAGREYQSMRPDANGRFWSKKLGVFVGVWHGKLYDKTYDWVRFFRPDGSLVPTLEEAAHAAQKQAELERQQAELERQRAELEGQRAELERQRAKTAEERAETERQRAERAELERATAEAEIARLRQLLAEREQG